MSTFYMSLDLPVVSVTLGPTWASELNTALSLVDEHDHTSGKGKTVPSAGININANLNFNQFSPTSVKTVAFYDQGAPLAPTFVGSIYVVSGDLYYNNGTGQSVKITDGTTINAASIGGIGGDYGGVGVTALESYELGSDTYHFYEDPSLGTPTYSDVKVSGVRIVNDSFVGSQYQAKIINPTNQTENYTIKLPTAISSAVGNAPMAIDSSGNMSILQETKYYKTFNNILVPFVSLSTSGSGAKSANYTLTPLVPAEHKLLDLQTYEVSFPPMYVGAGALGLYTDTISIYFKLEVIQDGVTNLATYVTTAVNITGNQPPNGNRFYCYSGLATEFQMTDHTKDLSFKITMYTNATTGSAVSADLMNFAPTITKVNW